MAIRKPHASWQVVVMTAREYDTSYHSLYRPVSVLGLLPFLKLKPILSTHQPAYLRSLMFPYEPTWALCSSSQDRILLVVKGNLKSTFTNWEPVAIRKPHDSWQVVAMTAGEYDTSYHSLCRPVSVLGLLRFLKLKPKPRFFPKTDWNPQFFLCQMNGFLSLDKRQDLQLRPNWDWRNNSDERACLSAPNFYLHTKMK